MKVVVDNFSVLAVEGCIISKLTDILSPEIIVGLDDALINAIAAETEDSRAERQRTTEKLQTLEEGRLILDRYNRYKQQGQH